MRRIVSVWLPYWRTERRERTQVLTRPLENQPRKPLAIIESGKGGRRLATVNQAAEAAGLSPGMLLTDACAILPSLKTEGAAPLDEAKDLKRLAAWCVPVRIAVIEAHDNSPRQIAGYDLHLRCDVRKGSEVAQLGCDRVHDVDVVILVSVDVLFEKEPAPIRSPVVPRNGPPYRVRNRPRLADSIGRRCPNVHDAIDGRKPGERFAVGRELRVEPVRIAKQHFPWN